MKTELTPEQKRIKIAELCGWKRVEVYEWIGDVRTPMQWADFDVLPNYLNDLNAMHEAEKTLSTESEWEDYINQLYHITFKPGAFDRDIGIVIATADQRAEAFLKVKGIL